MTESRRCRCLRLPEGVQCHSFAKLTQCTSFAFNVTPYLRMTIFSSMPNYPFNSSAGLFSPLDTWCTPTAERTFDCWVVKRTAVRDCSMVHVYVCCGLTRWSRFQFQELDTRNVSVITVRSYQPPCRLFRSHFPSWAHLNSQLSARRAVLRRTCLMPGPLAKK